MDAVADTSPLSSFEAKWTGVHAEFALALKFVPAPSRGMQSAFACLVYELEHAAFGIREAQPAALKLQWWGEEFARVGQHEARHPLPRALAAQPGFAEIALPHWYQVIGGALAQRDPEPAVDTESLLAAYAQFYGPLASVEAALFGADGDAIAGVLVAARALRETATLAVVLQDGRLPLPLDLLARHRLARGSLSESSPQRSAALREWLQILRAQLLQSTTQCGVLRAATGAVDASRAARAARADDPLATLSVAINGLSIISTWAAWRASRGVQQTQGDIVGR